MTRRRQDSPVPYLIAIVMIVTFIFGLIFSEVEEPPQHTAGTSQNDR